MAALGRRVNACPWVRTGTLPTLVTQFSTVLWLVCVTRQEEYKSPTEKHRCLCRQTDRHSTVRIYKGYKKPPQLPSAQQSVYMWHQYAKIIEFWYSRNKNSEINVEDVYNWASEKAQRAYSFTPKPDKLSWVPRSHMMEGTGSLLKIVLWRLHPQHTWTHTHSQTQ